MTRLGHVQELCNKLPEENQETLGLKPAVDHCGQRGWLPWRLNLIYTHYIGKITMVLGKNHYHLIQLSGL